MSNAKSFTIIALILSVVTVMLNWYWPWSILLFWWVYRCLQSGQAFYVEEIYREKNPILFWIIVTIWTACGIAAILYDIRPDLIGKIYL